MTVAELNNKLKDYISIPRSIEFYIWFLSLGVIVLFALGVAGYRTMAEGEVFGTTTDVPLGLLLSTYIFFVVSSTGMCLITSFGHVFGIERYELVAKRGVFLAIITLVAGFASIGIELERPLRFMTLIALSPNLKAPIWWMGTLYQLYMIFLIIELIALFKHKHKMAMFFGLLGFVSAISAHSCLGAVLGLVKARPFWYGPYMPIYFILSALVSGGAFLMFSTILTYRAKKKPLGKELENLINEIGKLLALFLGISIFFYTWKLIVGYVSADHAKHMAVMALLTGPLALNFWVFEVIVGTLIPFVMLLFRRFRTIDGVLSASILIIVGIFFLRYDLLVSGQIVSNWGHKFVEYTPSFSEISLVVGCLALCAVLYLVGDLLLNLDPDNSEETP